MKNLKSIFTALLLLCCTVATAHDFEVDGIYYNILSEEDKTVEVTYKGYYYNSYSNEYSGDVTIPANVTYYGTTYSVTTIGYAAFSSCSSLTSIEIPNSVTTIGNNAFNGCRSLTSIEIPNSVTTIGNNAFSDCRSLASITIPNSVTTIGDYAFGGCSSLASIEIPNSVTSIGSEAFYKCSSLTSIEIPNSVTTIGNNAFSGCRSLASIEIPNSVTYIGDDAFDECSSLTSISVAAGNTTYDSRDNSNAIIVTATNTLILGCQNTVIPNSVTTIGSSAFYNCTSLTSIEIPGSVTTIGDYAFNYCTSLTSITSLIPADKLFVPGSSAFYGVNKTNCTLYVPAGAKETYAATEGWNQFTNIVELNEITITVNQYGCGTYCSPNALDFSNVKGLKAYSAIGYKPSTQTVTLARVMTTDAGQGIFIKGEPGAYNVPIIDNFDEYTLNLLVGTLEQTTVNSTDGNMSNFKFTIIDGENTPMFYPFEENTPYSANRAYLQIPTAWLPASAAQKSVSIRFDEGETTDIEEVEQQVTEEEAIYNLQGQKVKNPTRGIYIINGKRVFIK